MSGPPVVDPALEDARGRFRNDILRRISEHDANAIGCDFYARDACLWSFLGTAFCGRHHVCGFWRAMLEAGLEDLRFEPLRIEEDANLAYEAGRFEIVRRQVAIHGVEREAPFLVAGSYLVVYRRQEDSGWRVVAEMYTQGGKTPSETSVRMPARSLHANRASSLAG